jgi:biofilm PGA synthesis N-glycosyltransferase PgaC
VADETSFPPKPNRLVALVPAHNEAASIAAVIDALLAQDRPLDRIVVVSDNSTDDTFAIASSYRDRGVVAVETSGNRHKKAGALNLAWSRFGQDADLVVTIDADTILPPSAARDWEREFVADPSLAGSSSKFTMLGSKLLVRLQRFEFASWTDTSLRRGWTSVLAGTGCCIRSSVLREIMESDPKRADGPWSYASQVEDFELTYRIRERGYHCHVSPTVRAYTDAMDRVRSLWGQRMKWQVGTVEDLLAIGVNRLTLMDWCQQIAGMFAAAVRVAWLVLMVWGAVFGLLVFTPIWFLLPLLFVAVDVKRALRVPHRDKWDVILAATLLPQEFFAWMRAAWFCTAWCEVLIGKFTGHRKDHWTLQYAAEGR